MMLLPVAIFISAMIATIAGQLTPSQHAFLQKGIVKRLRRDLGFLPRLVQISFHDCVGGCDGCVDTQGNPDNKGLRTTFEFAKEFRNDYAPHLSLADVISFLGVESLKQAARFANGTVAVPYSIGRQDCDSSRGFPERHLPHGRILDSIKLLKDMFALTDREAAALLGCHSLGGAHTERSGFSGTWDGHPGRLDNGFWLNIASGDWQPKVFNNENVNSTGWTRPNSNFLMLHADMAMLKDYIVTGPLDTPSCATMDVCPNAATAEIVFDFARSQAAFHNELGTAFTKMINHNTPGLRFVA